MQNSFTHEILKSYQSKALSNSVALLSDATLLFSNQRYARTYFLACSAIEEAGKAYLAFDAHGKNLSDNAIQKRIKQEFGSHSKKFLTAFIPWIMRGTEEEIRSAVKTAISLIQDLEHGRECAMYVDFESGNLRCPDQLVTKKLASEALRLANDLCSLTKQYLQSNSPREFSPHDNKVFSIGGRRIAKMHNTEDFWLYFLDKLESGWNDFNKTTAEYYDQFYTKGIKYKS